ncbi:MAG: 3-dehydroquinate synthase [Desulfobacterales bacterium]|nr:MAG: 3-dehydroquinate synthase [Desulfobacterales bacterium]
MQTQSLSVGLGDRSYPIHIGQGILARIGKDLAEQPVGTRYAIISDDNVAPLYAEKLTASLTDAGISSELFTFTAGEEYKHSGTVTELARKLAAQGFDRGDAVIALGGGVVGDMAGFLASIYMRGIPFVQIPTTLLAQVDSSVGGKTGVDIPEGKNLIGTFYQPKAVYIDIDVLSTLPEREFRGGLAEVIKYGVIIDKPFFDFLREKREHITSHDPQVLMQTIKRCCEIKADVVEKDEREGGLRRILNYGHTIGHAVEATSGYQLIHGLAVSIGMHKVTELALKAGYTQQTTLETLDELLVAYNLPLEIPAEMDRDTIKGYLKTDKKTVGGQIFFVLPEEIGKVIITDKVESNDIDHVLHKG